MSNIISFPQAPLCHFAVYTHKIVRGTELSEYRMIVLRDADGRIQKFTGLENLSYPYTGQKPKIEVRRRQELVYICRALNDICEYNGISRLTDITKDMIFDFFDEYCSDDDLTERSLYNCVHAVSHFFANLAAVYPMRFVPDDLLHTEFFKKNQKAQKVYKEYVPKYVIPKGHPTDTNIPRDIPLRVVQRLLDFAYLYDPMIAFAIVSQVSAGLRGSCPMNMRQEDSPVSAIPGLHISYAGTAINHISIDLLHTYVLRADGVKVGGIKKKRTVDVYPGFMPEFYTAYQRHLNILKAYPVDPRYKPMFVNRDGNAMTYATYRYRLHKLIDDHLIPELLQSSNPEDVILGQNLLVRKFSPHIFRHVFTVRLVRSGPNMSNSDREHMNPDRYQSMCVSQIMHYRGDTSAESALTYLANKGELIKRLEGTHERVVAGLGQGGLMLYDPENHTTT